MNIELMQYEMPVREPDESFIDGRKKGIGGSDAGAILGVNKYKSRFDVYLEKVGDAENTDNEKMYWGRELEDRVAEEFELRSDYIAEKMEGPQVHPDYPWMIANVDREIPAVGILEVKTASVYAKSSWEEGGVPASYVAQCQHYMAVTGHEKTFVAVLFGGQEFQVYKIFRDEDYIKNLIEVERDFWENNVLQQKAPEMDGGEACSESLKALYPESVDQNIELPGSAAKLIDEYNSAKAIIDEQTRNMKDAENKIKDLLGENERGTVEDYAISWKSTKPRETFDSKKFKADNPDMHSQYIKIGAASRRFSIKQIG